MRKPCSCSSCDKKHRNKGKRADPCPWTELEDQKLLHYIRTHGEGCSWQTLPKQAGLLRCGKSCRLRWVNHLRPGNFAQDEEDLIVKLHALLGNRWSLIAGRLPGRTDNEVKNYWNSHIRKKLVSMGIDPQNHRIQTMHPRRPREEDETDDHVGNSKSDSFGSNEQVSDAASSSELNLELTIGFPSSSSISGIR